jgi:hypothetical protein
VEGMEWRGEGGGRFPGGGGGGSCCCASPLLLLLASRPVLSRSSARLLLVFGGWVEGAARPREPIGEQKFLCSVSILAVSIKVSFDIALRSLDIFFISTRGRMVFPPISSFRCK